MIDKHHGFLVPSFHILTRPSVCSFTHAAYCSRSSSLIAANSSNEHTPFFALILLIFLTSLRSLRLRHQRLIRCSHQKRQEIVLTMGNKGTKDRRIFLFHSSSYWSISKASSITLRMTSRLMK